MKPTQLILPFEENNDLIKRPKSRMTESPIKISELKSYGIANASALSAEIILELGNRFKDESPYNKNHIFPISSPVDIYNLFRDSLDNHLDPMCKLVAINTKNFVTNTKIYRYEIPSIKNILRWSVSHSAAAFFICRNSYHGLELTSTEDKFIDQLSRASKVIGIELLDYIVIGATTYLSAREQEVLTR